MDFSLILVQTLLLLHALPVRDFLSFFFWAQLPSPARGRDCLVNRRRRVACQCLQLRDEDVHVSCLLSNVC